MPATVAHPATALGLALLARVEGDVALSPLGVHALLAAVRAGAAGETRAALDTLLGEAEAPEPAVDDPDIALRRGQAAWLAAGCEPGPALRLRTGPLEPESINAWARELTGDAIVDEVAGEDLILLTDAIHLEAAWATQFDVGGTRPRPFGGAGEVAMMAADGVFDYGEHDGMRVVRLDYGRAEGLGFVAVLADEGPPELDADGWSALRAELRPAEGRVELPRFTAESALDLAGALRDLGLGPAFAPGDDLDELLVADAPKALGRVLQRARIDVDERGTRAAATTLIAIAGGAAACTFELVLDRPFLWAVEDAVTGALLFAGRLERPTERRH
jgi:serpin B